MLSLFWVHVRAHRSLALIAEYFSYFWPNTFTLRYPLCNAEFAISGHFLEELAMVMESKSIQTSVSW